MPPPYTLPEVTDLGSVFRGDTIELPEWVALDRDGDVIDLTGATVWFTAKDSDQADDLEPPGFQHSTVGTGVEITEPTEGLYKVTIAAASTATLANATVFYWDVQVRTASGRTITVKLGKLKVVPDYTRTIA